MCPPREKAKHKKGNQKCFFSKVWKAKGSWERRGELEGGWKCASRARWHRHWGLCIRLLITFVYKPGPAIINADELSCLLITDFVVPLTLGIRRLL